ncbi:cytochrome P450 [Deinococcus sp. Leaf326]|uniref:cytochrome P450 n=1 Tax=Deinococcus sp. Leaf326 TaxID=1736338 RepID=UPI000AC64D6C|nr:cytochrome P450 [Deinococcus sp. Leaf326]
MLQRPLLQARKAPNWPAGPRGHALLGSLPELRTDALGYLRHVRAAYGDLFRMRLGPRNVLMVCEPAAAREVLVAQAGRFRKGRGIQKLRDTLGDGLLTADGETWRTHRRLMQPAFHRAALDRLSDEIVGATAPLLARLASARSGGQEVELGAEMLHVTLRAVAAALFGTALRDEDLRVVERELPPVLEHATARTRAVLDLEVLPTPAARRARASGAALDAVVGRIIAERRAAASAGDDLLGLLLAARDEEGGRLSDAELRDEVMTLFLAGHETTATLLTFLLLELSRSPEWRCRVQTEVRAVLGDRTPTAADLRALPLLGACIQEALRLYPPAWLLPRQATAPATVGGYAVSPDDNVSVNIFLIQRSARFWPRPDTFDPGRWLEGARMPDAFMPFGAGARMCIGNHLALLEATLISALVLRDFTLDVPGGGPTTLQAGVTLKPGGPVCARVG